MRIEVYTIHMQRDVLRYGLVAQWDGRGSLRMTNYNVEAWLKDWSMGLECVELMSDDIL